MLNFIALPRSAVLVNIVILHFLQVTLLLMFQLVTFIILLNEIFLYSSAPLTPMAAPRPLAGGRDEMNSSLIRNNNNKNTHAALRSLTSASLTAAASSLARLWALRPRPGAAADGAERAAGRCPRLRPSPTLRLPPTPATLPGFHPSYCLASGWLAGPLRLPLRSLFSLFGPLSSLSQAPLGSCLSSGSRPPSRFPLKRLFSFPPFLSPAFPVSTSCPSFFFSENQKPFGPEWGAPVRGGPCLVR